MKHAASRNLHTYWNALRAGRAAPEREDLDPAAIRHVLAYTFILDIRDAGGRRAADARFRLSGTRVNALFGRDLRGSRFDRLWTDRDATTVDAAMDGVLDDCAPVAGSARGGPPGYPTLDLELLLLPLRHRGRTHTRILGSLAGFATPDWMGLLPVSALELGTFRCLATDGHAQEPDRRGVTPMPPRSSVPRPLPRQIGRFRVYQGGRQTDAPHGARP